MVIISYIIWLYSILFLKKFKPVNCRYAPPEKSTKSSSPDSSEYLEKMPSEKVQNWVDDLVRKHRVVVFSKSWCPYSVRAKDALNKLNLQDVHVEEIEDRPDMVEVQDYLCALSGARTVPRVFVNGRFYGNSTDTVEGIKSGDFMAHYRNTEL